MIKYSFYNPKQHPMFDKDRGRIILFEGTYTTTFSGNQDPTPRYDYNQVMYQLDLSDPRLALPVPIYQSPATAGAPARLEPKAAPNAPDRPASRRVAFFAPDREGIATLPVYDESNVATGQALRVGSRRRVERSRRSPAPLLLAPRRSERLHVGDHAAL